MKNKIHIGLIILLSIISNCLKSQISNYLAQINATVSTIPYIFEGTIQSVEIFAGDDNGNKLPWSSVVWNGDIGYFYDATGNEAHGYSLAKIKICKQYKGDLNPEHDIKVLTKSFTLNNVYLQITGSGSTADTSLRFLNVPPSHDEYGDYLFILPHTTYPKKIYFCDRVDPTSSTNYSGVAFRSNFHSFLEMPFNQPAYVLQSDGSYLYKEAYCALVPFAFDDQTQLQLFLNQISTINPYPADYCDDESKQMVSIVQVDLNPFNISVYPNPSASNESIKIKFDLSTQTPVTILLTDIAGNEVINTSLGSVKNVHYDLSTNIETGVYVLQVNIGQSKQSFKIIKN